MPEVARLVGQKVFPIVAPASTTLPFVVYQRTGIRREATLSGVVGVPRLTLAYDILAVRYEGARELADIMRQSLDGWTGSAYGVVVSRVSLESESDGLATLDGGEIPPVYQVTQSYDVLWQEV